MTSALFYLYVFASKIFLSALSYKFCLLECRKWLCFYALGKILFMCSKWDKYSFDIFLFLLQATFFITYVLTSGWTSLCAELVQCFPLTYNLLQKYVFRKKLDDPNMVPTFPYHTEVPRVLLFGLLGFTCSILAPLILPFLMVYFLLGYLIYRNQVSTWWAL